MRPIAPRRSDPSSEVAACGSNAVTRSVRRPPWPARLERNTERHRPPTLLCVLDRPDIAAGEALAGVLRPGNAGSNTVADHNTVLDMRSRRCPEAPAPSRPGYRGPGRPASTCSFGLCRCQACVRGWVCRAWRPVLLRIPRRCADPTHRRCHPRRVLAPRHPDRRRPARGRLGGRGDRDDRPLLLASGVAADCARSGPTPAPS